MRISHEVVTILKKIKIFSTLTYSQLIQLSNVTEEIEVPAGNLILKEKESGGDLLIIVDGKVGLTFEGKSIGELEPYKPLQSNERVPVVGSPYSKTSTGLWGICPHEHTVSPSFLRETKWEPKRHV